MNSRCLGCTIENYPGLILSFSARFMRIAKTTITAQAVMAWLYFLYPLSLATWKEFNDIVIVLILMTALWTLIHERRSIAIRVERVDWTWIGVLCIPLFIVVLQHFFLSPPLGLREFENAVRFAICIPVFLALLVLRPPIRPFLWGCVLFLIYSSALMGWHMYILKAARGIAPNGFLQIIPHSSLAVILGVLTTRLWHQIDRTTGKCVLIATALLAAFSIPFITQTRTAILVIVFLCFFTWYLVPCKKLKFTTFLGVGAIVGLAYALVNSSMWGREDQTLSEISAYMATSEFPATSTTIRLELWRSAAKMFLEHPLIGVGKARFANQLDAYKKDGLTPPNLDIFTHPHNEVLHFASESGILGVASLFLLYAVPFLIAFRAYRNRPQFSNKALLALIFVAGYAVAGITDVMLAWKFTITFFGFVTSLLLASAKHEPIIQRRNLDE